MFKVVVPNLRLDPDDWEDWSVDAVIDSLYVTMVRSLDLLIPVIAYSAEDVELDASELKASVYYALIDFINHLDKFLVETDPEEPLTLSSILEYDEIQEFLDEFYAFDESTRGRILWLFAENIADILDCLLHRVKGLDGLVDFKLYRVETSLTQTVVTFIEAY